MNQTTPEPCLPECRCYCGRLVIDGKLSEHRHEIYMVHAPACPNAAPKASDAPKRCPECKHRPHGTVCFNGESDGDCGCEYGKPAPAPEAPKVEEYLRTGDGPDTLYPAKPAPAPKASEAPVEWDNTTVCFGGDDCPNCERKKRTNPAPEPGSWATDLNAYFAPAPEPKCYHCETCRKQCSPKTGQSICCNCKGVLDPEPKPCHICGQEMSRHRGAYRSCPLPEPKQGSEEPIDWKSADEWADDWNQFSPVAQANKYILSEVGWNARRAYIALRAELAAKDAEVASLKAEIPARMLRFPQRRLGYRILSLEHELAAEKAAREKAEARVGEDETFISVLIRGCRENGRCTVCHFPEQGHYGGCAVLLASAILAKRQKEESK